MSKILTISPKELTLQQKELVNKKLLNMINCQDNIVVVSIIPELEFFTGIISFDSLDFIEFVMEIEREFGFNLPDNKLEQVNNVGEFYTLLAEALNN